MFVACCCLGVCASHILQAVFVRRQISAEAELSRRARPTQDLHMQRAGPSKGVTSGIEPRRAPDRFHLTDLPPAQFESFGSSSKHAELVPALFRIVVCRSVGTLPGNLGLVWLRLVFVLCLLTDIGPGAGELRNQLSRSGRPRGPPKMCKQRGLEAGRGGGGKKR
jgi:hypothetical protein